MNRNVFHSKKYMESKCDDEYISVQNETKNVNKEQIEYYPNLEDISLHDILVITWNVNTHALTSNELNEFFTGKINVIQPKIVVLALQEVENVYFNFCPDPVRNSLLFSQNVINKIGNRMLYYDGEPTQVQKNKDIDVRALKNFFLKNGYNTPLNGIVQSNNQLLCLFSNKNLVKNIKLESTTLTSNFKQTKGALAVSCNYVTEASEVPQKLCFISAHLSAHSDLDENQGLSRHKYFLRRVDEMYDILHECNIWYKRIHGIKNNIFLPFNVILEGDLNFRMIQNSKDMHFDEGEIVLKNFLFNEIPKTFRQTYRFEKENRHVENLDCKLLRKQARYNDKRSPAWTDRITFHNSKSSQTKIKQMTYNILDDFEGPSDHLPVYSTFDIEERPLDPDTTKMTLVQILQQLADRFH